MISFKEGQKRFVAVAMSALLVATPILGGCTSSKATQQASQTQQEVNAEASHGVALSAVLSFVDKIGDNLKATFDLTALSGQFADNLSGSDVRLGMDLANAKVDSFSKGSEPSQATLTVEFPADGRTPDTISGYGDIVVDSKALRDLNGNEGVTSFPAVVSLASEDMVRGDDDFKMPVTKEQFDKYSTYVNKVGKTLGLKKDTVNEFKEAENYISQAIGVGEDIASGNYLKAGMSFLRVTGILGTKAFGKTDSMKLDEIINMLNVIEAKLDRQTELLKEISNKIDAAAIGAFKKELGELKNYVGYVNAYLEHAANNLAEQGITLSDDANAKSTDKVLNAEDYSAKLLETAKKAGDSGAISFDAATNGLVDHFSSVTSFLELANEQNPISIYYNYMTNVYNFDTQAYIETGLYMQDIDMTLQNVTALLYATTDPKNTPLLKKFEDQYNSAANALYSHTPKEPDWKKPYCFVVGQKVKVNAGILRVYDSDDKWRPDFKESQAKDFASRMHYGDMINELVSAGFTKYYVPDDACQDHYCPPYMEDGGRYIDVPIKMKKGEHNLIPTVLKNGFHAPNCSGLAFKTKLKGTDRNKSNFHDVIATGVGLDGKVREDKVNHYSVATGVGPTGWGNKDYYFSFWLSKA